MNRIFSGLRPFHFIIFCGIFAGLSLWLAKMTDPGMDAEMLQRLSSEDFRRDNLFQNHLMREQLQQLATIAVIPIVFLLFSLRRNSQLREQRKFLGNAFKLEKKLQPEAHQESISIEKRLLKKIPELTSNDLELITLLLEKSSSKEIAFKMNISPASVNTARYRLRKKLRLQKGQDLLKFLLKFS